MGWGSRTRSFGPGCGSGLVFLDGRPRDPRALVPAARQSPGAAHQRALDQVPARRSERDRDRQHGQPQHDPGREDPGAARQHQQRDVPQVEPVRDLAHPGERGRPEPPHAEAGAEHQRRDDRRERGRGGGVGEHLHPEARVVALGVPQPVRDEQEDRTGHQAGAGCLTERRPAGRAVDLDRQRDQHAAGEVRQERDRGVGRHGPPAGKPVHVVPHEAGQHEAAQEQRLAAGPPPEPQRRHADHRQQEVEDDLDRQRPGRRVELQQRVGGEVLPEHEKEGQLTGLHQPPAGDVAGRGQERQRPRQREVVGGRDAGRAAHEIAAHCDRGAPAEARAHERAVQEKARQHEEHHERDAALEQQHLLPPIPAQLHRVRELVDPHVDPEHDQGGDAPQAVERGVSAL